MPTESFDYIIIGAGTAGCVLANRLSEDANTTVLVIEAGEHRPDDPNINTPGLMGTLGDKPEYDWGFLSEPQKHLNGRVVGHPRGKLVGGSSAIQYGMIVWPSQAGINAWSALGNNGWSWDDMAPYYRKFHTLNPPTDKMTSDLALDYLDKQLCGTSGPLQVSFAGEDYYSKLDEAWPTTFRNLGLGVSGDPASGRAMGAFINPCSVDARTKRRSHSGTAYYTPEVARRPNLRMVTEALVEKILFEGSEATTATGVRYRASDGSVHTPHVNKEVIVCAGAIQSPQILELSGIGSAKRLQALGIKCVVDNPYVGENMQDHAVTSISFEVNDDIPTKEDMKVPGAMDKFLEEYRATKTGPLTSACIASAYLPVADDQVDSLRMDLDEMLRDSLGGDKHDHPGKQKQYALLREIVQDRKDSSVQYFSPAAQLNPHTGPRPSNWFGLCEDGKYTTIAASLSHPFSRGSVHIRSSNPDDHPTIDPQYLSHPLDLEILARHVLFIETVAATEPLASFLKPNGRRVPPGTYVTTLDEAKRLVKDTVVSTYHPAGTCAMMPREMGGVVDSELRVHGTANVRVCDASVFPLIPRGNIQTSVYAVAERGADIIRGRV